MKLTPTIAVAIASTLLLGACATEPNYAGYTGQNQPIGPCRYEKSPGSNMKRMNCEAPRDDAGKLEMIGTISR